MSEWLKSMVGYMLIVSVTMQMLPDKKYEQYVKLFTGFLLIVLVLQPLLKIGSASTFLENKISEFVQEQERLEQEIAKESQVFQKQTEKLRGETSERIEIEQIEQVEVSVDD